MNVLYLRLLVVLVSLDDRRDRDRSLRDGLPRRRALHRAAAARDRDRAAAARRRGREDHDRLRYGLQGLTEMAVVSRWRSRSRSSSCAEPALRLLGGRGLRRRRRGCSRSRCGRSSRSRSGACSRVGLLSLGRQRGDRVANAIAVAVVLTAGLAPDPRVRRRDGAAVAGIVAETMLLVALAVSSPRPAVTSCRPRVRLAAAARAGGRAATLLVPLPTWLRRRRGPRLAFGVVAFAVAGSAAPRILLARPRRAPGDDVTRPKVVLLRGHGVNPWELRPWELLGDRFDVRCSSPAQSLRP